jgi:tetratricopeptide (TPR) repeat protein
VLGGTGLDGDVAAALENLVDARLLDTGDGRYRLPELLRLLAAERLAAEEPPEAVRAATERMCGTYAASAEAAPAAQHRPTLVRLVRTAYDSALWALTVRLADALTDQLETHAAWDDWQSTHALALDAAARCGDLTGRARMLRSLGDLAWQHRRLDRAAELYGRARRAAETAQDREEYGRALVGLAELHLDTGATTEAAALLEPALAALTAPAPAHPRARYEARRALALLALQSGAPAGPDSARAHFTACLDLATTLHDPRLEAYARRALRTVHAPSAAVEIRPGLWRLRPRARDGSLAEL